MLFQVKQLSVESVDTEQRVQNLELLCAKFTNHVGELDLDQLGLDIATQLSDVEAETLKALWTAGPLDSGHLLSKTANDFLCHLGLVGMGVVKGEDGYYYCTQLGNCAYKGVLQIATEPEAKDPEPGELLGDNQ